MSEDGRTTPSKKKVAGAKRKADTDAEEQSKTDEKETVSPAATSSPPPASVDDESKEDDKAVDPSDPMTVDPATLGLPELKAQLKAWGLLYSGLKGDLIKRYRAHVKRGGAIPAPPKKKAKTHQLQPVINVESAGRRVVQPTRLLTPTEQAAFVAAKEERKKAFFAKLGVKGQDEKGPNNLDIALFLFNSCFEASFLSKKSMSITCRYGGTQ